MFAAMTSTKGQSKLDFSKSKKSTASSSKANAKTPAKAKGKSKSKQIVSDSDVSDDLGSSHTLRDDDMDVDELDDDPPPARASKKAAPAKRSAATRKPAVATIMIDESSSESDSGLTFKVRLRQSRPVSLPLAGSICPRERDPFVSFDSPRPASSDLSHSCHSHAGLWQEGCNRKGEALSSRWREKKGSQEWTQCLLVSLIRDAHFVVPLATLRPMLARIWLTEHSMKDRRRLPRAARTASGSPMSPGQRETMKGSTGSASPLCGEPILDLCPALQISQTTLIVCARVEGNGCMRRRLRSCAENNALAQPFSSACPSGLACFVLRTATSVCTSAWGRNYRRTSQREQPFSSGSTSPRALSTAGFPLSRSTVTLSARVRKSMATVATVPLSPLDDRHIPVVSTLDPTFSPAGLHLAPYTTRPFSSSPTPSSSSSDSPTSADAPGFAVPMGSRYEKVPHDGPGTAVYVRQPTRAQLVRLLEVARFSSKVRHS